MQSPIGIAPHRLLALSAIYVVLAASGCTDDASDNGERIYALSVFVTTNGRVIDSVTAELTAEQACELDEYEQTDAGATDGVVCTCASRKEAAIYRAHPQQSRHRRAYHRGACE